MPKLYLPTLIGDYKQPLKGDEAMIYDAIEKTDPGAVRGSIMWYLLQGRIQDEQFQDALNSQKGDTAVMKMENLMIRIKDLLYPNKDTSDYESKKELNEYVKNLIEFSGQLTEKMKDYNSNIPIDDHEVIIKNSLFELLLSPDFAHAKKNISNFEEKFDKITNMDVVKKNTGFFNRLINMIKVVYERYRTGLDTSSVALEHQKVIDKFNHFKTKTGKGMTSDQPPIHESPKNKT